MKSFTRTSAIIIGISTTALLAVTACQADPEAEASPVANQDSAVAQEPQESQDDSGVAVFDFSPAADTTAKELRVEIPDELLQAADEYRDSRVLEAITVRAAEHPDSACAIEVDYEYVDGFDDVVNDDSWWESGYHKPADYSVPVDERVKGEYVDQTRSVPERYAYSLTQLETALTSDATTALETLPCAHDQADSDRERTIPLTFNSLYENELHNTELPAGMETVRRVEIERLASVDVNVMASGDINVVNAEVRGFDYTGPEHGWISSNQMIDSQGNPIDR